MARTDDRVDHQALSSNARTPCEGRRQRVVHHEVGAVGDAVAARRSVSEMVEAEPLTELGPFSRPNRSRHHGRELARSCGRPKSSG